MAQIDFSNRTVLLTGATRGIGQAALKQLLDKGATVLTVARDEAALTRLEQIAPGRVHTLAADLGDPEMPRAVANWVADEHPDCSVLINNAAMMVHTRLTDPPADRIDQMEPEVAINLTAPMALCTAMLPVLSQHPLAAIANVTSGLALAPIPNAAVYCATKAGLRSFTRTLRYQCEDARHTIQISEVIMTLVNTSLSQGDPTTKMAPEQAAAEMLAGIEAGQREIGIGKVRLLQRIMRFSPTLGYRIMRGRAPA